ncbi:MAG: helix-turn-helix domain-containing protein [Pseudonocardiales bacterium]
MIAEHADSPIEPGEQRRRLGELLLQLREGTGLNQTDFGVRAGMNQSKVSRLETARQVPSSAEADAWARAAEASDDVREQLRERVEAALAASTNWIEDVRRQGSAASMRRRIASEERTSSVVRTFVTLLVPGLLQTAEYTRRQVMIAAAFQPMLSRDQSASLAAWAERKLILHEPGHRFEFVVTEAALRWRPGPDDNPRMLAAQMHHIASIGTLESVRFGVIPWRGVQRVPPRGDFIVYGEPGVDEDVHVDLYTATRELQIRDEAEIAVYLELWGKLGEDAVFGEDARELLRSLAQEFLAE